MLSLHSLAQGSFPLGGFVSVSDFEDKFQRAIVELQKTYKENSEKGFWATVFKLYLSLMKALRMRPIQYASFGGMWLRNAVFFLILMSTIDLVLNHDKFQFVQLEWWGLNAVGAAIYATIVTATNMSQFKRLGLSRWEDL